MSIITITTNKNGDILSNNQATENPFNNCNNMYDIEALQKFKPILSNNITTKKHILNILPQNYTIFQVANKVGNLELLQLVLIDWYVNNPELTSKLNIQIQHKLYCINNFSTIEQEAIYFILKGAYAFKDICYCFNMNKLEYSERKIKAALENLYAKFQVSNRYDLMQCLTHYKLNKYVPTSIIPPSVIESV